MSQERFYQLVSRKMAGEATIQELEELEQLLSTNAEWKEFLKNLTTPFVIPQMDHREADGFYAVHATKMQILNEGMNPESQLEKVPIVRSVFSNAKIAWFSVAAAVVVATLIGFLSLQNNAPHSKPITNEVVSKKGSRSTIKLPDGTKVWLNSDSKLTYAHDFSGSLREVSLEGEGFFDVVKDSSRPFIIHTEKINIRVLGTAFNVKSYAQDDLVETALIRGKIEVTYNDRPMEKIILQPNEKLIIRKNQDSKKTSAESMPKIQLTNLVATDDHVILETAWLENKFIFSNESLKNISHMLARRFDVEFEFKDDEVQNYTYTGVFERESLEKIMELISISESINYKINGNRVTISK
jgi:ferric-dicitrate binding protein FerR (iron transport regulator)